ncbi:laminin subunit alpha-like [Tubulanus polymorphus]|uniref:laminin subunit alpha-like n=1 Tax=Tubulanus polymorphus TaxID=672921 RepID=UPI003DA69BE7
MASREEASSGIAAVTLCCFILFATTVKSQVLNPPYFNLAEGKHIYASDTCGQGVSDREWYCKLTGTNYAGEENPDANIGSSSANLQIKDPILIKGQYCDYCDANDQNHAHPADYAVDGSERWWQSPPLSRGMEYNAINLTIDLGQEFHVAYVFIRMANSPRPGIWALERSTDYGLTWNAWQYFATSKHDCLNYFNTTLYEIEDDNSVICTTDFSKVVPLEGGEIVVSLVNGRKSANNFSYAHDLQEFTKATNVRLRLLRTKTLLGHLMAVARQAPSVTRRYFYSIKDINIGGRCVCNGHAEFCDEKDPNEEYKLLCRCQHHTCGAQCERCCEGFVQKKWMKATEDDIHECEPCNCHGHSDQCIYDEDVAAKKLSLDIHGNYEGGGVCQNCQHNTAGINCEKCKPKYYRRNGVAVNSTYACEACQCDNMFSTGECEDGTGHCKCKKEYAGRNCDSCAPGYYGYPVCVPCQCHLNGTEEGVCEVGGGQCPCKPNYAGINCDQCALGFYNFPTCEACNCNPYGSIGSTCESITGNCNCKNNYGGRDCGRCDHGYYGFPDCSFCNCDPSGTTSDICSKDSGSCLCLENYSGERCDQCADGFYNFPTCSPCQCDPSGSSRKSCDESGRCYCNVNFSGTKCDRCSHGYYSYPECNDCRCDPYGSIGSSCNQSTGQCKCLANFETNRCSQCKDGFYNYPVCEECNCNPAGAMSIPGLPVGGCGSNKNGELCECKERVEGRICDKCKPGFWNLNINNQKACDECNCNKAGTIGQLDICDQNTGQCPCKLFASGLQCHQCQDGTYHLDINNVYGCMDCKCDIGGAWDNNCDKYTGQCRCRPRVTGLKCDRPERTHFYPTLYQHQYELEDGHTPRGGQVRFGFDDNLFPKYSWKGYAIFSKIQPTVVIDVEISKPSIYRVLYRYINTGFDAVTSRISIAPIRGGLNDDQQEQEGSVIFQSTHDPRLATSVSGTVPASYVLSPGKWTISLSVPKDKVFVDYAVLLPEAFYEANILIETINDACKLGETEPCTDYVYVDVKTFPSSRGEDGFIAVDNQRVRTQDFKDADILVELGTPAMALLDVKQPSMYLDLNVPEPGMYILVFKYYTPEEGKNNVIEVEVASTSGREKGKIELPDCSYSSLCRAAVHDQINGHLAVFNVSTGYVSLTITGKDDVKVAIDSVVAIPVNEWDIGIVKPRIKCVKVNGKCTTSEWPTAPAAKITIATDENKDKISNIEERPPNIDIKAKVIKLDKDQNTIEIKSTVGRLGKYKYVLHYYQPYKPRFDVNVTVEVGDKIYHGKIKADFCPSTAGCRAVIEFANATGPTTLELDSNNFKITLNNTNKDAIWVDYVIVIPDEQFKEDITKPLPIDNSGFFLTNCVDESFQVKSSASEFCKNSVFTITTDYNNGAIACDCNIDGSLSFDCEEFSGQCQCKSNIIGRTCSKCKTGFYGFPNCQRCECPSGLCAQDTGKCICPPRVTGDNCDECISKTFGYDPLIGCEECNCQIDGVRGGNTSCNIHTGQCNCRESVSGRQCDRCTPGYYAYPHCEKCNCDPRGTTDDICDQRTARCLCKENTEGALCETCKPGTFFLDDRNHKGCTNCFCFGTTDQCQSSNWRQEQVRDIEGWTVTNMNSVAVTVTGDTVTVDGRPGARDMDEASYWVAPEAYLGNKVTAYGGRLRYTVMFTLPRGNEEKEKATQGFVRSDIILKGNNMTIGRIEDEQPAPGRPLSISADMLEDLFYHEDSGQSVSHSQFMRILSNLEALHIRASYYTMIEQGSLSDISFDIATPDGRGDIAFSVEQCRCPPSHTGSSCEECVDGYYKKRSGTGFVCAPCECNGHTRSCDPRTGECIGCRDNTKGFHCDKCIAGHYGDPLTGDCQICSCPKPITSNNFATSCEVVEGEPTDLVVRCDCLPGYAGPKCDSCEIGFYGNPNEVGGTCDPCGCSGNINLADPQSCEPLTGACLICLYNTTGSNCEHCLDWYYGDAVIQKNCRECSCNRCGAESCNDQSGQCQCKPNVAGLNCGHCAPYTWDYNSCEGCKHCQCGLGSVSPSCDVNTGQCECKHGVTGHKCDQCKEGFWNLTSNGCQSCQCVGLGAATCDRVTGVCRCLQGYTGPTCAQCEDGWIMVPGKGCQQCDNCVYLLMQEADQLTVNFTQVHDDLKDVSVGVFALRRLENINETVIELRPRVNGLVVNPRDFDLTPIQDSLRDVKNKARKVNQRSETLLDRSERQKKDAEESKRESAGQTGAIYQSRIDTQEAVRFVQGVLLSIQNSIDVSNIARTLADSESILERIQARNFTEKDEESRSELNKAQDLLERVKGLQRKINDQKNRTRTVYNEMVEFEGRLRDLLNHSQESLTDSKTAMNRDMTNTDKYTTISLTSGNITEFQEQTKMMLNTAQDLIDEAKKLLKNAKKYYKEVERELSRLDQAMEKLKMFGSEMTASNEELRPIVDNATNHALKLKQQAAILESMIRDTKESADAAIRAAEAYENIVKAIGGAKNQSTQATTASESAVDMSKGLGDKALESKLRSEDLLDQATKLKQKVSTLNDRYTKANEGISNIEIVNMETIDKVDYMNSSLIMLREGGYGDQARDALQASNDALNISKQIKTDQIVGGLPERQNKLIKIDQALGEAKRNMSDADTQINNLLSLLPNLNKDMKPLYARHEKIRQIGLDISANITALKEMIKETRGVANRIRVAMTYYSNTTLRLRNPQKIETAGSFTKVTLYFRTKASDGFLLYMGPDLSEVPPGRQVDYMALEIINGFVTMRYDLGSGAAVISNKKNVADGNWHEVIAERIGKSGTLTVRTQDEPNSVAMGTSPGTMSVLKLDPIGTRFYAGGVPTAATIPSAIQARRFIGCLEDLTFDEFPVGLWNFIEGEHNGDACIARSTLQAPPPDSYRFDGNGYIVISKDRFRPFKETKISMKFKTYAENGLMLFMGVSQDFLSLEMSDGKVQFQYNLGGGRAMLVSSNKFNDGQWHTVEAKRYKQNGVLKVDGSEVASGSSPGDLEQLSIDSSIYVGGFRGKNILNYPHVTPLGFEGCIKDLVLGLSARDLSKHVHSKGIIQGCPDRVARVASFASTHAGYVAMPTVNINRNFETTLKFRTTESEGLIMYSANEDQSNSFSLALKDGKIVVMNNVRGDITTLPTPSAIYGDGKWHYISFTKNGTRLQLDVDDSEVAAVEAKRRKTTTSSPLFFGGAPDNYKVVVRNVATSRRFIGCVGDVTVNGKFMNFAVAAPSERKGSSLVGCPIQDVNPTVAPIVLPLLPGGVTMTPGQCVLPVAETTFDKGGIFEKSAMRFGLKSESRFEYDSVPGRFRISYEFQVEIKTTHKNGLIFFVADSSQNDYILLYMKEGAVVYSFNTGSGAATVTSKRKYNDGLWHTVKFWRNRHTGRLYVDDDLLGESKSLGRNRAINVNPPFYVGGMPNTAAKLTKGEVRDIAFNGFVGCIRDFRINDKSFGTANRQFHTQPCYMNVEPGVYYGADGGYAVINDQFKVGLDRRFILRIRPRSMDGILLSVSSQRGDYLIMQMVNGELIFSVDNGNEEITAKYIPPINGGLCDGKWHEIIGIKAKNVVMLKVDGVDGQERGIGDAGVSSTDTNDPLYVGGIPETALARGRKTNKQYVGCIFALKINNEDANIGGSKQVGDIVTGCPVR